VTKTAVARQSAFVDAAATSCTLRWPWWTPRRILAAAFAGFLIYAYPGYMSPDSVQQLEHARSLQYGDWHPPTMSALWTILDAIVAGPAAMLVVQGGLLLLGSYRLLRRAWAERVAALAALAILWFPPVLAPMAVIWKDAQMAGALVMGTALLLEPRRGLRALGVALLALAIAMRANAPAAALPLLLLLVARDDARRGRALALGLAVWLGATVAAFGLNRVLTRQPQHAWACSLGPGDIVGMLRHAHGRYTEAELAQVLDGTPLVVADDIEARARRVYTPISWWPTTNGDARLFDWPTTDAHRAAIARAWWSLVRAHPAGYARHRWKVFREVLGTTRNAVFDPAWQVHLGSPALHHDAASGRVQAALARAVTWLARTPLFRPYLYAALALLLLPLAARHRDTLALVTSGLVYELTLLPFAPSPDYRYSHWMVTCTVVAAVLVVGRHRPVHWIVRRCAAA